MKRFKNSVLVGAFFLSCFSLRSQVISCPNWTKTDCNGNSHTLYNYLDSNKVVAMIFGMGCSSCTDAAGFFASLRSQYMISHPGRFKAFYMDFFSGNTCANNVNPIIGNSLDAGFDSCANELAAYTSASPMTYVAIVGGSSHSIIYSIKKYIFDYSDSVNIKTSIDNFFNSVGLIKRDAPEHHTSVYPNPTHDKITINSGGEEITSYSVYDCKGRLVKEILGMECAETSFSLAGFNPGEYNLLIKFKSGRKEEQKIIKQN